MSSSEEEIRLEVVFEIEKDANGFPKYRDYELLLCKPLDADCTQCVIASVPFYLNIVTFGDTISTRETPEGNLEFVEVVQRSGYSICRIYLHDQSKRDEFIAKMLSLDSLIEQNGD